MNLEIVKNGITRLAGKQSIVLQKHSPEILLVVGIGGLIGSTVMACRATLRAEEILDETKNKIETINQCADLNLQPTDLEPVYSDHDKKKDLTIVYTQTFIKVAKVYSPAIIFGTASIACIVGGHNILRKRNVALMAAYKLVDEGFKSYRQRVVDEYGEDKDYMLRHGLKAETITDVEIGEDGKSRKVKKNQLTVMSPGGPSVYARFFDETSTQWSTTPEYNLMFLRAQQNYFNDLLKVRGSVFLNEIYDALGMERSSAGTVVGWVFGKGDGFIDFGLYDGDTQPKRDFVNGYERSVLLDFNVDGVIYDLI